MAFNDTQKSDIRFFLGYPDVYRQVDSRLENAMDVVGSRPEPQLRVELLLAKLNAFYGDGITPSPIDGQINFAGIAKVESRDDIVEYGNENGVSQIGTDQSSYARRLVSALSSFMGVPIGSNIFGSCGYTGDHWMSTNKQSNGFGFLMNI